MGPVAAPAGTLATNWPKVTPVGATAATPLNRTTRLAAFRLAPVIVTEAPTGPKAGEKPARVGGTTKFDAENAAAPATMIRIRPVLAPTGTTAVRLELLSTAKLAAGSPLKKTAEVPTKLVPVINTLVLARPEVGETLAMSGLPKKFELVTKLPKGLLIVIGPVVKPPGACTWIDVSELALRITPGAPLKATLVTPVKCKPSIVTVVPASPDVGVKSVM